MSQSYLVVDLKGLAEFTVMVCIHDLELVHPPKIVCVPFLLLPVVILGLQVFFCNLFSLLTACQAMDLELTKIMAEFPGVAARSKLLRVNTIREHEIDIVCYMTNTRQLNCCAECLQRRVSHYCEGCCRCRALRVQASTNRNICRLLLRSSSS